ncbi:polysaccharide pyruvyl transferase family protein [Rubripirellula amarantea]|nr:polysaccharide pyruvyl transferase family protein [Rubripirellula amarantea]
MDEVPAKSNQFLVFGYFGGWNSGDEAILDSVWSMLEQEYAPASVTGICTRISETISRDYQRRGVRMVKADRIGLLFRLLKTHRLVIGGGQMLTGDRSSKGMLFVLLLCWMGRLRGQRARLIGIGTEGVTRFRSRWLARRIVASSDWIGCRDDFSHAMLIAAGCQPKRLKLTADVVFSAVLAEPNQALSCSSKSSIVIGLHRSPLRSFADASFYRTLIASLRDSFPDRSLIVVSNDVRENFDAGLLCQLQADITDTSIRWQNCDAPREVLATYANAACVISVRMHPLILALINSVPVVGIAKSNKVKSLAKRVGFPLYDPELMTTTDLKRLIDEAIAHGSPSVDSLLPSAWKNIDGLLET